MKKKSRLQLFLKLLIVISLFLSGCDTTSDEYLKKKYPHMKEPQRCIKRYIVEVKVIAYCPLCKTETVKEFWDNQNDKKNLEDAQWQLEFWKRQYLAIMCPKCHIIFKALPNNCKIIEQEYGAANDYYGDDVYISDWGN